MEHTISKYIQDYNNSQATENQSICNCWPGKSRPACQKHKIKSGTPTLSGFWTEIQQQDTVNKSGNPAHVLERRWCLDEEKLKVPEKKFKDASVFYL